ncbi:calcium-translocating P-type ATPase, PMCA-type protein (macronuclear) [Tetrahymena thermophila SB210]|uniref:Calcium-transporting ATPase n=1 Tax=Tetrahymena thermophila (strain SB210) TaxID=312017 RepID=W7WZ92_TETTS|nr:calcium-translocating P-type ATPase, PMCA-type protein [Tetrahymena thermophila SB210]EWS72210.1 calcium-translocating P-type ATPase, PMCA-type protein [Tetrahymena thermophila SB210]|eukprot:XP_012655253.1 calcium-translocating P-type ATPase, PMCA-type protein [Tetrahymena thermophila SB210]
MAQKQRFKEETEPDIFFKIDPQELSEMFDIDNIRDHHSSSMLRQKGGPLSLLADLHTSIDRGINQIESEIEARKEHFGENLRIQKEPKTLFEMIIDCFEDLMLQILCLASLVSTTIGILEDGLAKGWMEGATILIAVLIIVSISAGNNYIKEQQFLKLNAKREEITVKVKRNGQKKQIDCKQLLVGDILYVEIGDVMQVDGILMEGSEIQMDESSVTGESDHINKTPALLGEVGNTTSFLISGSKVMDGTGLMLVCAVGQNTQLGKLREKLQDEQPPTPLQQKLETVAEDIGKIGTVAAALTMLAINIHLIVNIVIGEHCFLCIESAQAVVNSFLIGITIIVVAVPEGLPLAVTIALAYSVNKMKDENNLVKELSSCEIMGGATNICSDKTGTLTQNIMSVSKMYIDNRIYKREQIRRDQVAPNLATLLAECICVNSSADPEKELLTSKWVQIGNKTECALIELADQLGFGYQNFRTKDILRVLPFSSTRKKMTTVYRYSPNCYRVYVKGASEVILERCTFIKLRSENMPCDYQQKEKIKVQVIKKFADDALRTLALAYKDIEIQPGMDAKEINENFLETNLTLIGIAGIKDPLRPEIPKAIKTCHQAGITVRMVTGDNVNTAVAIAKDCGILPQDTKITNNNYEILEGKKFRELVGGVKYENPHAQDIQDRGQAKIVNFDIFKQIVKDLKVLARSTPEDKYLLVTGLIQMEEVVAVTGDGTNDAPALKKADVGFAMGIAGTEIAKEAAGIILLDDNFASIITACKWGRNIYDSIRKFIQFQLTVNAVALFMCFMGAVILKQSPLNSIQMLWVNLIMDTFASLALSTEPPSDSLLKRMPYGRNDSIITPNMWRNIAGQSLYQITILSLILFKFPEWLDIQSSIGMVKFSDEKAVHFTIFFQAFVLMQVFNEFNARKLERNQINVFEGLFNNWLFWLVILFTFFIQFLMVSVGGEYVGVTTLTITQHLICMAIGSGGLLVGVLIKIFPNELFNHIQLFREEAMEYTKMDQSFTSIVRKKSSIRYNYSGLNVGSQQNIEQQPVNSPKSQQKINQNA